MTKNKSLISVTAVLVLAVIATGIAKLSKSNTNEASSGDIATFTVKRGPLNISVIESGTIKSREQVIIKSEVEGRTSILSLVDEGTHVKKGDLLIELDSSELVDRKIDQQISVQNNEASFISARENLAVAQNKSKSDIDQAELDFEFAKQDLKKYLEGEYPNELKGAKSNITLKKEECVRAEEQLKWSEKLFQEDYLSQTELQSDQLAANRAKVQLEIAESNLDLLKEYTYKRNEAQFESDVSQAEMALERAIRKAKADIVQAEADLRAKESEFNRQKDKLEKIEENISKTKIYAPSDGLVIYATSAQGHRFRGNDEPLDEGQEVRERQELFYLPTTTSVTAETNIHESSLQKINTGLPARITVDALPGKVFTGHVAKIAPLPDPTSAWLNPDLKVYTTDIYLDNNDSTLRTGMSCRAEIIIEQYKDALYVPIQTVMKVGGAPTVYVVKGKSYEPRKIETGLDNNRMIHVTGGLEEGELVLLAPPLAAGSVDEQAETGQTADTAITPQKELKPGSQLPTPERPQRGGQQRKKRDGRKQGMPNMQNMTPEQMQKMKERFENMSPEEKEKIKQKMMGAGK